AYDVWGIVLPHNSVAPLIGPHRIKSMRVDVQGVVTNKTPNAPYRGAGRPETVFAMDRILDRLGRELRMDPAELRRKNYIRADELPYDPGMPYRDGNPLVYDTGDFPAVLEQALAAAGYDAFRRQQARPRVRPRLATEGARSRAGGASLDPDLRRARRRVTRLRGDRLSPRADRHLRERRPRRPGGDGCRDRRREAPALRRRPRLRQGDQPGHRGRSGPRRGGPGRRRRAL